GDGAAVVPEPGTWLMLVAGFGIVGVVQRRSARRDKAVAA
ncbi:PEPxxWA-CTERM sorting domain-containing protein, partial [Sandarakinorhabdus sp.]